MTLGVVGKKCGMTRVFKDTGESMPVTVVHVEPNRVVQVKTPEQDGYCAVQVATGQCRAKKLTKPMAGHYKKANVAPGTRLWEFLVTEDQIKQDSDKALKTGTELTIELFSDGQMVDVVGMTKGKGYAGVVKKYHFKMQDATHGNSLSHRAPGSIGQRQTPGRVMKGKHMAGRLGVDRRTIQNQEIVKIDKEKNLLLIKGAIPGAPGGMVMIYPAVKKTGQKE